MHDLLKQFEEWNDFVLRMKDADWNVPLGEGKWSVHDVVSHIMFWDKYFFEEAIERISNGRQLTLKHLVFDEFNREAAKKGKDLPKEQLIELTLKYRNAILDTIKSMTEDQRSQTYKDADGNDFSVATYLRDFIWHDRHHMRQIEEVIHTG
jgi:Mycothiol maleylpyruvate isomerase N-terminal domain.